MVDALAEQFRQQILGGYAPQGEIADALVAADYFLDQNDLRMAAAAYDRAFGLNTADDSIANLRGEVLDQLAIEEHGLVFRYIPAGTFLMGSETGDPDEQPVHPESVGDLWMAEVPLTWAAFNDLMGWGPPPQGMPPEAEADQRFHLIAEYKIRLQYCESGTLAARDWHAHSPADEWSGAGGTITSGELFGRVPREDPNRPFEYNVKPLIAVSWQAAEELCRRISTDTVRYRLPSEAEWERAARGGRIGAKYPWGDDAPDAKWCDFGHFGEFAIKPPHLLSPNGYGLYGMCGGVWEWTSTDYDALAYSGDAEDVADAVARAPGWFHSALNLIVGRSSNSDDEAEDRQRVLRGGSWADCAEACTVSFRMSRQSNADGWSDHFNPTIGVRLCRSEVA